MQSLKLRNPLFPPSPPLLSTDYPVQLRYGAEHLISLISPAAAPFLDPVQSLRFYGAGRIDPDKFLGTRIW